MSGLDEVDRDLTVLAEMIADARGMAETMRARAVDELVAAGEGAREVGRMEAMRALVAAFEDLGKALDGAGDRHRLAARMVRGARS